jgi:uncharacterized protein (TIGR02996 family)
MEAALLQAIHAEPRDQTAWLVLADWLEEDGQSARAELLRLRERLRLAIDVPDRPALERRLQRLVARKARPVVATWTVKLPGQVELPLSLIPAGKVLVGSPGTEKDRGLNEDPRHEVTVSKPFYLGVYPVTQAQWRALRRRNRSTFRGPDRPVDSAHWSSALAFCDRLGKYLGRPCRLPYEAEWEYACRAGTTTSFHTGDDWRAMWRAGLCSRVHQTGSAGGTTDVGQYLPNAFGLYDVHGNVREWCQDDMREYTAEPQTDPRGPEEGGTRVLRGGSWYYGAEDSRSACRYNRPIDYDLDYYGFRVVVPCE